MVGLLHSEAELLPNRKLSYCNSILQCLYYSVPFREHVLTYPKRSPLDTLRAAQAAAVPRPPFNPNANGAKKPVATPINRNANTAGAQAQKPEDKESPEYKKKQALTVGPILNMSYQNAAGYDMSESLFTALKDIFEGAVAAQSRTGVISPSKLLEVLRKENEMFRSAMHQDAHEFLNLLLNSIVENIEQNEKRVEAKKAQAENPTENGAATQAISFPSALPFPSMGPNSGSSTQWLRDLFEGTLTSETRCLTCENVSQRDEPFLDLSVDLDQHTSVTSCLRRFSEEEMLCERNKFHCDNCGGLQEAEKRMKIKKLPKILALHLKRFKYTEDLQRLQKLFHKVVYPFHLRLFNTTDDAEDPDRLYELYAVVVHIGGGPYHGHYVAIIKTEDRGWLLFDDEMVEPVEESYIRNFFGDRPGLACAYVLFYRETTEEAVKEEQRKKGKRRASQDIAIGLGVDRTKMSAELARVQSISPPTSPADAGNFASLNHAVTAPQYHPKSNGNIEPPSSPLMSPTVAPATATVSKKETAKEEKARKEEEKAKKAAQKVAEKEQEKAEKQRQKDLQSKMKEAQKRADADFKEAMEASKRSKAEEERKSTNKENAATNGSALPGSDAFKRSKSIKFGTLGRKDKPVVEEPSLPSSAEQTPEKDKEKKNRFSLRKKSFGMLNS
jgi:ubiquitin carboxyl-terminal hydrolase 9/13